MPQVRSNSRDVFSSMFLLWKGVSVADCIRSQVGTAAGFAGDGCSFWMAEKLRARWRFFISFSHFRVTYSRVSHYINVSKWDRGTRHINVNISNTMMVSCPNSSRLFHPPSTLCWERWSNFAFLGTSAKKINYPIFFPLRYVIFSSFYYAHLSFQLISCFSASLCK